MVLSFPRGLLSNTGECGEGSECQQENMETENFPGSISLFLNISKIIPPVMKEYIPCVTADGICSHGVNAFASY